MRLRPGVHFSNGREVAASDVEFSLLRGLFSPNPNFFREYLTPLLGIPAPVTSLTPVRPIEGVQVVDTRTLRLRTSRFNPEFLSRLSYTLFSLVPREELASDHFTWKKNPIGAGGFTVEGASTDRVVLSRRSGGKIVISGPSEDADVFYGVEPSSLESYSTLDLGSIGLKAGAFFNPTSPLGNDRCFRESVYRAFKTVSFFVQDGPLRSPLRGFLENGLLGASRTESAWEPPMRCEHHIGKKGEPVFVPVRGRIAPDERLRAVEITLERLGYRIKFRPAATKFSGSDEAAAPFSLLAMACDGTDPLLEFSVLMPGSPFAPFIPSEDKEFARMVTSAVELQTYEEKAERMRELSRYLVRELHFIPLFQEQKHVQARKQSNVCIQEQPPGFPLDLEAVTFCDCRKGIN